MAETATRQADYEDLLRVPDHLVAEILNGRLRTHPRPGPRHAYASSVLGGRLVSPFGSGPSGDWWILDEPELHLGAQVMVPDLAGWRREELPALPEEAWFEQAPTWVCEVLSPSTAQADRSVKMPLYARFRVDFLWLLDPSLKTLEAYEREGERWLWLATHKDDEAVRLPPFAGLEFSLAELWP